MLHAIIITFIYAYRGREYGATYNANANTSRPRSKEYSENIQSTSEKEYCKAFSMFYVYAFSALQRAFNVDQQFLLCAKVKHSFSLWLACTPHIHIFYRSLVLAAVFFSLFALDFSFLALFLYRRFCLAFFFARATSLSTFSLRRFYKLQHTL